MNGQQYQNVLREAFLREHGCRCLYVETVRMAERVENNVAWEGDVVIFELIDHPTAARGYAWIYTNYRASRFVTALELPVNMAPAFRSLVAVPWEIDGVKCTLVVACVLLFLALLIGAGLHHP